MLHHVRLQASEQKDRRFRPATCKIGTPQFLQYSKSFEEFASNTGRKPHRWQTDFTVFRESPIMPLICV